MVKYSIIATARLRVYRTFYTYLSQAQGVWPEAMATVPFLYLGST